MPTLVITCGATGAGKTRLSQLVLKRLNIGDYEYFGIDDLITTSTEYKQKVNQILKKYCSKSLQTCFVRSNKNLMMEMERAYFSTRREPNKDCVKSCDELLEERLRSAFLEKRNILFESTCGSFPSWLLSTDWTPSIYNIVFAYSLVTSSELIERNKNRSANQLKKYLEDVNKNPAPRFVNLNSIENLSQKIKHVLVSETLQGGSTKREYDVIVYSNDKRMHLLFDSRIHDSFALHRFVQRLKK
jgi:Cdc6-like AAA superfamily ATPase